MITKEIISKQEFDELMQLKGEIRGGAIKQVEAFLMKEEGKEGLEKLEKIIKDLGYPMSYNQIKVLNFYPLGMEAVLLLAAERLFGYDDDKFQKMGEFAPKTSIILIRMFIKYFVSVKAVTRKAPDMWKHHYTVGQLKVVEVNKEKRRVVVRLENFHYVPMACHVHRGYFISCLKMILKKDITCQETKCVHRGDNYHEFLITW